LRPNGNRRLSNLVPKSSIALSSRLLLALAATLSCLLAVEIAFRALAGPIRYHREKNLEFDRDLGFATTPGFELKSQDERGRFVVRFNRDGFRGRELPAPGAPKPEGVRRIAVLGDSFLIARAVRDERLVTTLMERQLARRGRGGRAGRADRTDTKTEVFNLSTTDYGTAQQLMLLRKYGPRIRPDAVILALYPHNDLINNHIELAGRSHVSPGDYLRPYLIASDGGRLEVHYTHPVRAFLRRYLHSFAVLERRVIGHAESREIAWLAPWPAPAAMADRLAMQRAPREDLELFRVHPPGDSWETAWGATFDLLKAFREETRELGAEFLVLAIPHVFQVQRDAVSVRLDLEMRGLSGRGLDEAMDWNLPERRLAAFFEAQGVEARFLLDPLRRAVREDAPVYAQDYHLAWRGHAVAAATAIDGLRASRDTAPQPSTAGHTRLLPEPENAAARLDFRRQRHMPYLVWGGWTAWRESVGWAVTASPTLVLRPSEGDLVVRGTLAESAELPVLVEIGVAGGPRETYPVEKHGACELRLAEPLTEGSSPDRYIAVELGIDGETRGKRRGLFLEQVGFEAN